MARIKLILLPYDSGLFETRHGLGPKVFIENLLVDRLEEDGHQLNVQWLQDDSKFQTEISTSFNLLNQLSNVVKEAQENAEFPLIIAGNCNASVAVVAGLEKKDLSVVWLDAHADFNTPETTESGFLDGMGLAMIAGKCWTNMLANVAGYEAVNESNIVLAGARDNDPQENDALLNSKIFVLPDITDQKRELMIAGLQAGKEDSKVHIHLDLDVFNPAEAPVNQYQAPGGPSVKEVHSLIEQIILNNQLTSLTIASYNPSVDPERVTTKLTIDLILSLLRRL